MGWTGLGPAFLVTMLRRPRTPVLATWMASTRPPRSMATWLSPAAQHGHSFKLQFDGCVSMARMSAFCRQDAIRPSALHAGSPYRAQAQNAHTATIDGVHQVANVDSLIGLRL